MSTARVRELRSADYVIDMLQRRNEQNELRIKHLEAWREKLIAHIARLEESINH